MDLPVMSGQLLFLFSALGAVNGILLALYLFSRPAARLSSYMLGGLLLAIGFRTLKSTFYYFNADLAIGFIQFGLAACLLIGPLTFLYVDYQLAEIKNSPVARKWYRHFLLPLLLIGIASFFPYSRQSENWYYAICCMHLYWFAYLVCAGKKLLRSRAVLLSEEGKLSRQAILLLGVYFSSFLILAAYVSTPFTSYIVGALSFTFTVHVSILTYILKDEQQHKEAKKYQNRRLSPQDAAALLSALNEAMCQHKLYLNPGLSLALLAKKVGHLPTTVSQVINDNLQKSFNLYINEFRIEHARRLLIDEAHLTMELVAERSGFNSNSTFFAAFKKITGQTPASYRAAHASGAVLLSKSDA